MIFLHSFPFSITCIQTNSFTPSQEQFKLNQSETQSTPSVILLPLNILLATG